MDRKHPTIQLVNRNQPTVQPQQPSTSSGQPVLQPARKMYSTPAITSFIPKRRTAQEKKDIDEKIMALFTLDFQPFRIVEDQGFRSLINFAFPHYTIPSRKYFSNNVLPAMYEKVRAELKERVSREVNTICITADMWSSCNNDSVRLLGII